MTHFKSKAGHEKARGAYLKSDHLFRKYVGGEVSKVESVMTGREARERNQWNFQNYIQATGLGSKARLVEWKCIKRYVGEVAK